MFKKPRGGFASEEGMSVLEVVLASVILFFVLTAVFSLVITSTRMGISAKERTAVTNAMTSHLEWVRSLDFEQVAVLGTDPDAMIPSQVTYSVYGFTVVLSTSVSEGSAGIKEVQVDAVASKEGYPTITMSQHASVRDYESGVTQMLSNDGPRLVFDNRTPAEGTVVYSQYVAGGAALVIDVDAESSDPAILITDVRMYCSGQLLREGSSVHADVAAWQPMSSSFSEAFGWNTLQVDDDGNPNAISDGLRTVRVEAVDQSGKRTIKERRFLVDNTAPDPPAGPQVQVQSDIEARIAWTSSKDGTDDAWGYGLKLSKVGTDGQLQLLNPLNVEGEADDYRVDSTAYIQTTSGFSRYRAEVRAYSPRLLKSAYVTAVGQDPVRPTIYVTKPRLAGTSQTVYSGKNAARTSATTVNIGVQTPTFGTSSIRYDLYREQSIATLAAGNGTIYKSDIGPTFNETITKTVGKFGTPDPWYYRYKITYTPSGPTAAGSEVIWSNIIGPITSTDNVLTQMPFVQW